MKLILVRHGQTLWNREKRAQGVSDIELSNRGRAQADSLAQSLQTERIDAIVSSPLKRALQTAEAINRFHHLPIEPEEDLMELDMGDFEGIVFREMMKNHEGFLKRWAEDPASVVMPGGESLTQLQARVWGVVERIIVKSGTTLLAAHNFTIMTILCRIKGMDLSHIREVHVDVASKTFVEFKNGRGNVILFNDIGHLDGCENVID
ncbi:MAG: histidine phosphatase family protein [Deltaproteobacteria bacterium]|nr:histidine phosphatase family protein [Deltaproteobacteria bacterium]